MGDWNVFAISTFLFKKLEEGNYDAVISLFPSQETHGHHKAATLLLFRMIKQMQPDIQPTFLGAIPSNTPLVAGAKQLRDFREITLREDLPPLVLDKEAKFGFKERLTHQIIVNWVAGLCQCNSV